MLRGAGEHVAAQAEQRLGLVGELDRLRVGAGWGGDRVSGPASDCLYLVARRCRVAEGDAEPPHDEHAMIVGTRDDRFEHRLGVGHPATGQAGHAQRADRQCAHVRTDGTNGTRCGTAAVPVGQSWLAMNTR